MGSMNEGGAQASRRLGALATRLVASLVPASAGDIVRLACEADGGWFYCRVQERLSNGDLLCTVVDAQWWPSLMIEGILPGATYTISPDCVLSVVARAI